MNGNFGGYISSTKTPKEYKNNQELMSLVDINKLNYGNIICYCELVDCIEMTDEFIEKIKKNRNEYVSGVYAKGRYACFFFKYKSFNLIAFIF